MSSDSAVKKILSLQQPWGKKLPHCGFGRPLYTSADYAEYQEEQNYEYLWEPKGGDPINLFVHIDRNIGEPTETSWGMYDLRPIVTVGTKDHKLIVKTKASLKRFLSMLSKGYIPQYKTGDLVYFGRSSYQGIRETMLGEIVAIECNKPDYPFTWCVKTTGLTGWVQRWSVYEPLLNTTYNPADLWDKHLVDEMLETLTSYSEVQEEAEAILQNHPTQLARQREFTWFSRRLWKKFAKIMQQHHISYLGQVHEETLDAFAARLKTYCENP